MFFTALLLSTAIVVQDQAALRSAPRESALQQAVCAQGDTLEVRGTRFDYLQVYDHHRERAGYIRAAQVRTYELEPATAPELLSVVRFLRDTPGAEALGIGYAALFLKAAEPAAIDAEIFDALGTCAERLARRASARKGKPGDELIATHLDVAARYGLSFYSFEQGERMQICYDGETFRRVLALPATAEQQVRAALALTKHECVNPDLGPVQQRELDLWRAEVLDRIKTAELPGFLANRIRLRRVGVWAKVAYHQARQGEESWEAAQRAIQELAGVDKAELAEGDLTAYTEAAVRASASRLAADQGVPPVAAKSAAITASAPIAPLLAVSLNPGQPGETCVKLIDATHDPKKPLLERCTYGIVWPASVSVAPHANALALAVQTLDSWRELWLFHQSDAGWQLDVLPPDLSGPGLGYIEWAGWSPDSTRLLTAREALVEDHFVKWFEIIRLDTLEVEKRAESPAFLTPFYRWQAPTWKSQTLSLR